MPFADRDRRQTVQEPVHHLHRGLRRRIADAASDDHRSVVAVAASQACTADVLRQATDEPNGCGCPERRQVVVIDPILQAGIADLIEADELVEPIRSTIRHHQAVKRHGQPRFAEALDRLRFAEQTSAGGNHDVLPTVRIQRVRDQAVHGGRGAPIESIRQNGINERSFEDPVQRPGGADRTGSLGRTRLLWSGRTRSCASRLLDWGSRTGLSLHTVQPRCPCRCSERGISDFVNGGCPSCGGHSALHRRLGPANIRSLRLRSPTQDDVAGKQTLVFAAAPLLCDRVRRRRRGRLAVRSRIDNRRGLLRRQLRQRLRLECSQTVLVVAHAVGARSDSLSCCRSWSGRRLRPADHEHDQQHECGETGEQPRLHAAGQYTAR